MIAKLRAKRIGTAIICLCLLFSWGGAGFTANARNISVNYLELNSERSLAAAKALQNIQQNSFDNQREYCGVLYLHGKEIIASKPTMGTQATCSIGLQRYSNYKVVATYHTHGRHDEDYDNEVPSSQDLRSSQATNLDDYVATPGGRLWLVSASQQTAFKICDLKCLRQDTRFVECVPAIPHDQYNAAGLRGRGPIISRLCN